MPDTEPPEIAWLLDHAGERESADEHESKVYKARYDEQAAALAWAITHRGEPFNRGAEVGGEALDKLLRVYGKSREKAEAAREAERRAADLQCEEQRRVFPMGAEHAPPAGRRAGRTKGTTYAAYDAPAIAEMRRLRAAGEAASLTDAARIVVGRDGAGARGNGTPEAKIKRLVKRAKASGEF